MSSMEIVKIISKTSLFFFGLVFVVWAIILAYKIIRYGDGEAKSQVKVWLMSFFVVVAFFAFFYLS